MLRGEGPFGDDIDAAVRGVASQQLFLSATHCRTGRNALFANFRSPAELQRCILASAAIPRSLHPFDLLRAAPTYPEAGGIIVDPACEWDGGVACARLAAEGLPFSPHGEAYVDGGISDAAPTLRAVMGTHALTVSPISGPEGLLDPGRDFRAPDGFPLAHYHLCPVDTSWRLPGVVPRIGGMRCYVSRDNLQAAGAAGRGATPKRLEEWYARGKRDAERWIEQWAPPSGS